MHLQHLQEVTAAFSRSGTVSEVAEAFVSATEALFGGRAGALYKLVPGWGVLELVASPRYADTVARMNARVRLGSGDTERGSGAHAVSGGGQGPRADEAAIPGVG